MKNLGKRSVELLINDIINNTRISHLDFVKINDTEKLLLNSDLRIVYSVCVKLEIIETVLKKVNLQNMPNYR